MVILLVILKAASFYYNIFDHMTNVQILNKIIRKNSYHARTFSYNHGFITKENFYKFHSKNQKQPSEMFWQKMCS